MKYALLGYDLDGTLDQLPGEGKRALHARHGELGEHAPSSAGVQVVAHYRFRPSPLATIRPGSEPGAGALTRSAAAATEPSATLRALYILESDDPEAVLRLAEQLPATRQGATVEIWPLTEPRHRRASLRQSPSHRSGFGEA
jgi:hypothetical protein